MGAVGKDCMHMHPGMMNGFLHNNNVQIQYGVNSCFVFISIASSTGTTKVLGQMCIKPDHFFSWILIHSCRKS